MLVFAFVWDEEIVEAKVAGVVLLESRLREICHGWDGMGSDGMGWVRRH